VLAWTTIAALFTVAVARLVPISDASSVLLIMAEASLVGGVPLCVLVAQDLRWVSRALVTGLVFGLRYWSEYLAIILVGLGIRDGGATPPSAVVLDTIVVVTAILIAIGFLMIRAFQRLAMPFSDEQDDPSQLP
jgi:hypothetical protein